MDDARLQEIRERAEKATVGPWKWVAEDVSVLALYGPRDSEDHVLWSQICEACQKHQNRCTAPSDADASFIAHARRDIPDLLDHIDTLKAEMATTKGSLEMALKGSVDAIEVMASENAILRAKNTHLEQLGQQLADALTLARDPYLAGTETLAERVNRTIATGSNALEAWRMRNHKEGK